MSVSGRECEGAHLAAVDQGRLLLPRLAGLDGGEGPLHPRQGTLIGAGPLRKKNGGREEGELRESERAHVRERESVCVRVCVCA